ncbi:MAG: COG4648 family protein [Acidithiobacillus ferrivorans]
MIRLPHFMANFLRRKGVGVLLDKGAALMATGRSAGSMHAFWKGVLFLSVLIGYQMLTYVDISAKNPNALVVLSAFIPIIVALFLVSRCARFKAFWIMMAAISGVIIWRNSATIAHYIGWICMVQRSALFTLLAFAFGLTLRSGHIPLVSRIAEMVHGPLNARLARYTRQVTVAWTLFFTALAILLFLIFFILGQHVWVLISGTASTVLIALMFIIEYVVRCRQIPISERGSMGAGVRAYFADRQSVAIIKSDS